MDWLIYMLSRAGALSLRAKGTALRHNDFDIYDLPERWPRKQDVSACSNMKRTDAEAIMARISGLGLLAGWVILLLLVLSPIGMAHARASEASASAVVGAWYGTARTVGTIVLRPDGSYEYGGVRGGKYHVEPGGIAFTGVLAAWNKGHATLKNGNLEFYWTSREGWKQWFSFAKGR